MPSTKSKHTKDKQSVEKDKNNHRGAHHKLTNARIERYYNKIVAGFVGLTVILIALIAYFSFSKTTIIVHAKPQDNEINIDTTVSTIGGKVLLTDIEGNKKTTSLNSTSSRPGKSSGTVKIVNNYTKAQPLIATTRLLSKDGVLFRTQETVTVPAGGSVEVTVTADQEGAAGNIGPSRFEVVALWDGLKDKIYAESTTSMTGGLITESVLTQKDIDTASTELTTELTAQAHSRFQKEVAERTDLPEHSLLLGDVYVVNKEISANAKAGDTIGEFTTTGKITIAAVVVDSEKANEIIQTQSSQSAPNGLVLLNQPTIESADVQIASLSNQSTDGKLEISVPVQTVLTATNPSLDKKQLTNKTRQQIENYLNNFDTVDSVELKFSPFWLRRTPTLQDHITVTVVKN